MEQSEEQKKNTKTEARVYDPADFIYYNALG
jgi:hypothetical protein